MTRREISGQRPKTRERGNFRQQKVRDERRKEREREREIETRSQRGKDGRRGERVREITKSVGKRCDLHKVNYTR